MTDTRSSATATAERPSDADPRATLSAAADIGATLVGNVRPDQLHLSTPCEDFDVSTLLGHLMAVLRRVAAIGRAEHPFSVPEVVEGDLPRRLWSVTMARPAGAAGQSQPTRAPSGPGSGARPGTS